MPFLLHVLVALAVIIATTRIVGHLFRRIAQPAVMGELVGGILLGPSFFGWIAPDAYAELLRPVVLSFLRVYAQVGVILFMFLIGLDLDVRAILRSGRATIAISHASIVLPFALGYALAHPLYPRLSPPSVPFMPFALFLGVAMSVTAFPVLARILRERGITRTRIGAVALACAAVDDATAWCLLALVVSIAEVGDWGSALAQMPAVVAGQLGHYAIFAAFLCGAMVPSGWRIVPALDRRLEKVVSALLLPVFFAFSGVRTEIGLLASAADWALCAAIIAVACLGKFGGAVLAARIFGFGWRDSTALGVLMNTRGLVELIVLNIGLDLGILSPTLFTMLVIMALVTTFMTSPLLGLLFRSGGGEPQAALSGDPERVALHEYE
jgi:Kef-type K+ transport system membrane component KefB